MYEYLTIFIRTMAHLGVLLFGFKSIVALIKRNGDIKLYSTLTLICLLVSLRTNGHLPLGISFPLSIAGIAGIVFFGTMGVYFFYKRNIFYKKCLLYVIISIFLIGLYYK
ncbi:putative membrane protein [Paenibacillus sp. 4624]